MSEDALSNPVEFNRGVVRPMECLREGWQLIRNDYWLFVGISLVGVLIAGAVPLVLQGPMMCGIYLCLLRKAEGKRVSFEMMFKGFDRFLPSLIATLITSIPGLVLAFISCGLFVTAIIATMPGKGGQPDPEAGKIFAGSMGLVVLLAIVIGFVSAAMFLFIYPLIADRGLSGVAAVRTSMRAALANIGGILGLLILVTLMTIVGLLACYVGAFFVMPIHFAAIAVAYRKVFVEAGEPDQATDEPGRLEGEDPSP
jgi:hypothetical protein